MKSTIEVFEPNESIYAYDDATCSCAIIDVPIISLHYDESHPGPTFTTTPLGFLTRDPIGYEGSEWDLYESLGSNALVAMDPDGLHDNPGCARRACHVPSPYPSPFDDFKNCIKSLCCPMAKCGNCREQAEQLADDLLAWYKNHVPLPPDRCQKFMAGTGIVLGTQKYPCFKVEQFFVDNPWPLPNHTGHLMRVDGCATIKKVDLGVFGTPKCGPV